MCNNNRYYLQICFSLEPVINTRTGKLYQNYPSSGRLSTAHTREASGCLPAPPHQALRKHIMAIASSHSLNETLGPAEQLWEGFGAKRSRVISFRNGALGVARVLLGNLHIFPWIMHCEGTRLAVPSIVYEPPPNYYPVLLRYWFKTIWHQEKAKTCFLT